MEAYLKTVKPEAYLVHWHGRNIQSIKTTWQKMRKRALLLVWFVPKTVRHTLATWLRQRGVPA